MAILTSSSNPIDRFLEKMFKIPFYREGDTKEEYLAVIKSIFKNFKSCANTTI